jgi:hypothetical protein
VKQEISSNFAPRCLLQIKVADRSLAGLRREIES